ncbi:LytTR family DNA-binding domain-containing protein [Paraflavitalea sp. CAU 1676]|uniref:LytR/AlgR family response regulator transcription factor n=1 Tax=Paraflavitalea sp. CAU 1676 TaxID=3032598 RepID=UPI0023D9960D|nr:LytTR family DNA-binding domain-containing protein [Paraflavitalea sp. CAU 1676]MDF2189924.1 LytTR family DNA-binding domain-containing protein [Paraflavitalea sp. CAU 1676]
MAKKVLIIDDEDAARLVIRQYLGAFEELQIVGECSHGQEAVTAINRLEPDLVFLDVQMPGLSGFQVIQQIVHVPQIIFTTAYDQYALKAFDSNAIDYLLKPYTLERFKQAVSKVLLRSGNPSIDAVKNLADQAGGSATTYSERILVESGNKMTNIQTAEIIYLEAERDYTRLHTEKKNYLSNYGIGVIVQRLDPRHFIRIHRSYIVNINHIKEVYREDNGILVITSNNVSLKVSRSYTDDLRRLMY